MKGHHIPEAWEIYSTTYFSFSKKGQLLREIVACRRIYIVLYVYCLLTLHRGLGPIHMGKINLMLVSTVYIIYSTGKPGASYNERQDSDRIHYSKVFTTAREPSVN